MKKKQCDNEECLGENIGLINGDWLCLDCGEKVEPPVENEITRHKLQDASG
tara:strand:+ start:732 stop:884 length:153 start_codon:yes stop_codon:yes gene_type:complete